MAALVACLLAFFCAAAGAADYPAPKEGEWVARNFRFHTGDVFPEVRLHYRTVGNPAGEPVLVLHGSAGSSLSMLTPGFAGELFGPGQPLDASRYYLIIPDSLGTGKSTRPSDGLRARFPQYNYDDMVNAQWRLLSEGLGIKHLRLIIGNSMGGMQAWMWSEAHPEYMDAIVPMACLPSAMSGRNWMLRRMLTQSIRNDPDWMGGNYTTQPKNMSTHLAYFSIATSGGNQGWTAQAPTSAKGDDIIKKLTSQPFRGDANDTLFQWESSFDYDPLPMLERIQATVLAINAADDERNPPELGVLDRELKRIKNASYYLIPASAETRGHGTTGMARFYKDKLAEFLKTAPKR
jgi:homoserine O-acetyltransferase